MHIVCTDHWPTSPHKRKVSELPPNTVVTVEGSPYVVMVSGVALIDLAGDLRCVSPDLSEYIMRQTPYVIHGSFRINSVG
ncbi:MAG: hypothetical protein ACK45D_00550 [Alphaproteobacteria bacterium]|jgi:hypothetical protein